MLVGFALLFRTVLFFRAEFLNPSSITILNFGFDQLYPDFVSSSLSFSRNIFLDSKRGNMLKEYLSLYLIVNNSYHSSS